MRNPKRMKRILNLLEEIWTLLPDWRFGQLIYNGLQTKYGLDMFNVEDSDLEIFLVSTLVIMESQRKKNG